MANKYVVTVNSVVERIRETAEDKATQFITTASDGETQVILKTPKKPNVIAGQEMGVQLTIPQKKL